MTCIGDEKNFQFMETKYGNSVSDKALKEAYKEALKEAWTEALNDDSK